MKLIVIRQNLIPCPGYKCMCIPPFLFVRRKARISDVDMNHEEIHARQCYEMLIIFFYAWYLIEFLLRLLFTFNWDKAYKGISFEKEAYTNQKDLTYLNKRKFWAFLRYL